MVKMQELFSGTEYNTYHDKLSNPLYSGKEVSRKTEANPNPEENPKNPKPKDEPIGNSEEAPMRTTRLEKVIRPNRLKDFDYSAFLYSNLLPRY